MTPEDLASLGTRCKVAVGLAEPLYLTETEWDWLRWKLPPHPGLGPFQPWSLPASLIGVPLVIDPDHALLQSGSYGLSDEQLAQAQDAHEAEQRAMLTRVSTMIDVLNRSREAAQRKEHPPHAQ